MSERNIEWSYSRYNAYSLLSLTQGVKEFGTLEIETTEEPAVREPQIMASSRKEVIQWIQINRTW